jgi:hypothetical protein
LPSKFGSCQQLDFEYNPSSSWTRTRDWGLVEEKPGIFATSAEAIGCCNLHGIFGRKGT